MTYSITIVHSLYDKACAWVPRDDEEFEVSDEEECLLVFIQLCSAELGKVHDAFQSIYHDLISNFVFGVDHSQQIII